MTLYHRHPASATADALESHCRPRQENSIGHARTQSPTAIQNRGSMVPMPRQSKGDRDQITTRPSAEVGRLVRERAAEAGLAIGDYVAVLLSHHVDRADLAPATITPKADQELPMTG